MRSAQVDRVDTRGVVGFVLIAYLPAWLLTLPMWVTGQGLSWNGSSVVLMAIMFMPAIAALVVRQWISPSHGILRASGITNPGGIRSWWHYALLAWLGPPLVVTLALAVGYLLGVYHADWTGFSGLAQQTDGGVTGSSHNPVGPLVWSRIAQVFLVGWLNVIPAFGEEWGWRGYLLPALLPLGQPGAFLVTGVLWGLWHAPLLVLGYDYPDVPIVVSFVMMACFCTLVGVLLGWLRLTSRSIWPAVIAHGFLNASAGLPQLFSAASHPVDNVSVGVLGWSGWLVLIAAIVVLASLGKLPVEIPAQTTGIVPGVSRMRPGRKGR